MISTWPPECYCMCVCPTWVCGSKPIVTWVRVTSWMFDIYVQPECLQAEQTQQAISSNTTPMSKQAICKRCAAQQTQQLICGCKLTQSAAVISHRTVWEQRTPECHRNVKMSFCMWFCTQWADRDSVRLPTSLSCYISLPHALSISC